MKIIINTSGEPIPAHISNLLRQKLQKLILYSDRLKGAEVTLRKTGQNNTFNKVCQVRLEGEGHDLLCRNISDSYEQSIDSVLTSLSNVLQGSKKTSMSPSLKQQKDKIY